MRDKTSDFLKAGNGIREVIRFVVKMNHISMGIIVVDQAEYFFLFLEVISDKLLSIMVGTPSKCLIDHKVNSLFML